MKIYKRCIPVVAIALFLLGTRAFAQFSGYFSGYYAPGNWATAVGGNPSWQSTAQVDASKAAQSVEIIGAVDAQQQTSTPIMPLSTIDYTILLQGTGLQPVAFGYLFTGASDGYDSAQLIYYNGSGVQVTANLSAVISTQHTYSGQALGGRTIDLRVYSNNDNSADTLIISAVPEPSILTLLGLGASALLWKLRRRLS